MLKRPAMQTMRRIEDRWWPAEPPPKGCWFAARRWPHVHERGGKVVIDCAYAKEKAA